MICTKKDCGGCVYYGGGHESVSCCNYIFMEDGRRPCPVGAGCTVKKKGKKVRGKRFSIIAPELDWDIEE